MRQMTLDEWLGFYETSGRAHPEVGAFSDLSSIELWRWMAVRLGKVDGLSREDVEGAAAFVGVSSERLQAHERAREQARREHPGMGLGAIADKIRGIPPRKRMPLDEWLGFYETSGRAHPEVGAFSDLSSIELWRWLAVRLGNVDGLSKEDVEGAAAFVGTAPERLQAHERAREQARREHRGMATGELIDLLRGARQGG